MIELVKDPYIKVDAVSINIYGVEQDKIKLHIYPNNDQYYIYLANDKYGKTNMYILIEDNEIIRKYKVLDYSEDLFNELQVYWTNLTCKMFEWHTETEFKHYIIKYIYDTLTNTYIKYDEDWETKYLMYERILYEYKKLQDISNPKYFIEYNIYRLATKKFDFELPFDDMQKIYIFKYWFQVVFNKMLDMNLYANIKYINVDNDIETVLEGTGIR